MGEGINETVMAIKLHYQIYGEGDPIIIMHGLFGSNRNWTSIAKQLADNYKVITVDLRNHGDSDHAPDMSFIEMADDIVTLIDECGLQKATLIGHSMGGKVAMAFGLLHQACLDQLIVLDIAPFDYGSRFEHLIDAMLGLDLDTLSSRKQADEYLAQGIPETFLRQSLLQNLSRNADKFYWRIQLQAIRDNLSILGAFPDLQAEATYNESVLFLRGGDSNYIQTEHHPIIKGLFPAAEIDTVESAGHWLHIDQPDAVLTRIRSFLNRQ